ncbi:MAG: type III-B CRISPR module-associated protein Cmr3, partial [Candidatus Hydrothermae bacterium]|nr:type III-B CRISPR module-associated protein Cmr3 [Candidatus Hydrothermae bacterium]
MNRKDHNALQTWMALPHDSLIFRDGRPFTAVPGARAKTLPFPFPSTIAGAIRTRSGALGHGGLFPIDENVIEKVKSFPVVGPF